MRVILLASAVLLAGTPAMAQTTNCQWIGSTWSCQQSPGMSIDFGRLQQPNPLAAYQQGLAMRAQVEAMRQQQAAQAALAQAPPPPPRRWSKDGATQESFMQDRYACLKEAVRPDGGGVSAVIMMGCMSARGYVEDPNGFGPPAGMGVPGS